MSKENYVNWTKDQEGNWHPCSTSKKPHFLDRLFSRDLTLNQALQIEAWLFPLSKWQDRPWSDRV